MKNLIYKIEKAFWKVKDKQPIGYVLTYVRKGRWYALKRLFKSPEEIERKLKRKGYIA